MEVRDRHPRRSPAARDGATLRVLKVGRFSEQVWGGSDERRQVRRWYLQAQVDGGQRRGASSEELAEIKDLKAKVRRLEEDNDILRRASIFFAGELDPRTR